MKTVIAGGGIGGLVTALYATHHGDEVTLIEQQSKLGGRMQYVENAGFKIDAGPTIVLLPDMIQEILQETGFPVESLDWQLCDPLYTMNYPDGSSFRKFNHPVRQMDEIEAMFPGEGPNYARFLEEMKVRFEEGRAAFLEKAFLTKRSFFTAENMKALWRMKAYKSVRSLARTYFSNPRLQEAFYFQTLYIGGQPSKAPAMYSLVPFSEQHHGIWYLKGGYAGLIEAIEAELRRRGVTIRTNEAVTEVTHESNRAVALQTETGEVEGDRFIMNGDFPVTKELLKEQSKKPGQTYEPSSGCLLIYLGLNRFYADAEVHQFFMNDAFDAHMTDVFKYRSWHPDPSFYVFYPSLIDETLAPAGKSVMYMLVPVPAGKPDTDVERYAEAVIEKAEARGFSGLCEAIEWKELRTPQDAEMDGLFEGGSFGLAPTLMQSGAFRPQLKPYRSENVYAVGASIHPGGGVPIVMQGAKLLARYLYEDTQAPVSSDGKEVE
ncbi:phytoene desaturase [Salsuginibacillus halophilus]|uniref:Phytoene desaturase n=1 Tax=Salsuginibacillus halophilus TaxID=517424 RepID=A0A2P8HY36_9BACI|nr:phytoene desaturase family protein [Salsuginibacillus halophilus]PSL51133.1 phytoene desaturase [Salsuginibacillus halophilus]